MSINKFQEKVFRTGCGSAVLYVCAAVFFGGMFYTCSLGNREGTENPSEKKMVAVEVGGTPVYYEDIEKQVEAEKTQMLEQMTEQGGTPSADSITPQMEASAYQRAMDHAINDTATYLLAKKSGVQFTDDAIRKQEEKTFEDQVMMMKFQLQQQKKLSSNPTDKEFDEALKKVNGSTLSETKKIFHQHLEENLKDTKVRTQLEMSLAKQLLLDQLTKDLRPTDVQIKSGYDDYVMKRILFVAHPGSSIEDQVAKAKADIKAGMNFDDVINRYSGEQPPKAGGKPSQNSINLLDSQIDLNPVFKPIRSMKINDVSDVIDAPDGKSIYKLLIKTNAAPKDFDKKKDAIAKSYAETKAQPKLDEMLKSFLASSAVSWKLNGIKALWEWSQAQSSNAKPDELVKKMSAIVDEAKKAMSEKEDSRPATIAWYVAFESIWTAPKADKVKLAPERIEVLKAVTEMQPYFELRMELVDLLADAKAGDEAVETLKAAAGSNYNYDVNGQKEFGDVQAKMEKLKKAGILKPQQEADIQKLQDAWKVEFAKQEDEKAKLKADEEKAKKEQEANDAKQKAELEKQKGAAKPAADGSVTQNGITAQVVPNPAPGPKGQTPPAANKKP